MFGPSPATGRPGDRTEGRGFLLRAAPDAPWAGWAGSRFLEEGLASVHAAPGRALARLMNLAHLLPGGFGLRVGHPPAWMEALPAESRQGWWEAISAIPRLTLHLARSRPQLPRGGFPGLGPCPEAPGGGPRGTLAAGCAGLGASSRSDMASSGPKASRPRGRSGTGWLWGE